MKPRMHGIIAGLTFLVAAMGCSLSAQAQQICGPEIKAEAAKELGELANLPEDAQPEAQAKLYEKYKFCLQEDAPQEFHAAARQCGAKVSNLGSTYYEEMSCCGYDPQRRQFGCPVKVKQRFGFGGAPLPGSREYVLNCVQNAAGVLQPVGVDSVHLADEMFGAAPTWQFAVITSANQNLQLIQPMNAATRQARSILSWGFQPPNCNFVPIWGNAINYRIRLDQ